MSATGALAHLVRRGSQLLLVSHAGSISEEVCSRLDAQYFPQYELLYNPNSVLGFRNGRNPV
jgi:hypothetical protein